MCRTECSCRSDPGPPCPTASVSTVVSRHRASGLPFVTEAALAAHMQHRATPECAGLPRHGLATHAPPTILPAACGAAGEARRSHPLVGACGPSSAGCPAARRVPVLLLGLQRQDVSTGERRSAGSPLERLSAVCRRRAALWIARAPALDPRTPASPRYAVALGSPAQGAPGHAAGPCSTATRHRGACAACRGPTAAAAPAAATGGGGGGRRQHSSPHPGLGSGRQQHSCQWRRSGAAASAMDHSSSAAQGDGSSRRQ